MDKRTVITAPGIYQDVSIDDYHADKSWISSTGLKHAKRSLAEFRMWSDGHFDAERKAVFDFGNAFELALLDHDGFDQDVAIMPTEDWEREALEEKPDLKRPKQSTAYQSRKSAWETDHAGKYWIPDTGPESFDTIRYMLESCYRDSLIQKLIKNIEYQNSLYWIDETTGLRMKTRPDFSVRNYNVLVNLKTATDASPEAFRKHMLQHDYPLQAVVEIEGALRTGLFDQVDYYYWLVVEKNPPYCAQLYRFMDDSDDFKRGITSIRDDYHLILDRVRKAMDADKWPGYSDRATDNHGIIDVYIPSFYQMYRAEVY